jgi:hypothetical protein
MRFQPNLRCVEIDRLLTTSSHWHSPCQTRMRFGVRVHPSSLILHPFFMGVFRLALVNVRRRNDLGRLYGQRKAFLRDFLLAGWANNRSPARFSGGVGGVSSRGKIGLYHLQLRGRFQLQMLRQVLRIEIPRPAVIGPAAGAQLQ